MTDLRRAGRGLAILVATGWLAATVVAEPTPQQQQQPPSPSAAEILDRYVEVTGGASNYRKFQTRYTSGTVELEGLGIRGPMRVWQRAPASMLTEIDLGSAGLNRQGSNGEVLWETGLTGPRILQGAERAVMLRLSAFNAELLWRDLYPRVEVAGQETVEGRPCWKVVLTPSEGKPVTQLFDRESGLMVKMAMVLDTQMGEIPVETSFADYRAVDGILVPHRSRQQVAGISQILVIDRMENGAEIPAERFEPPPEIRALLEKAAAPRS